MAKYTQKNDVDLAWNRIRREVGARAMLASQNWREEKLNEILPALQQQFEDGVHAGELLELTADDIAWINNRLEI